MAAPRAALTSVLGTVADTATAISGMVNTISGAADMANAFVNNQRERQRLTYKLDNHVFQARKLEEISLETAQRKAQIHQTLKDPELVSYYNETYGELQALLNPQAA